MNSPTLCATYRLTALDLESFPSSSLTSFITPKQVLHDDNCTKLKLTNTPEGAIRTRLWKLTQSAVSQAVGRAASAAKNATRSAPSVTYARLS
jgi:hypothetical protein